MAKFHYGPSSMLVFRSLHSPLQELMTKVLDYQDVSLLCGYRGRSAQEEAFRRGVSRARWGESKHNVSPSHAVDLAPYPIDWDDELRFSFLAGRLITLWEAMPEDARLGFSLVWGGDWDSDTSTLDQQLRDLGHFELRKG